MKTINEVPSADALDRFRDQFNLVEYCVAAFHAATDRLNRAQEEESAAARERANLMKKLYEGTELGYEEIGEMVGLSAARINQLVKAGK